MAHCRCRFNSPVWQGIFLPLNFHCRLSYGVCTTPVCNNMYLHICAHVKDPVVHVWVRWIMEILKHPACTIGWAVRLCRSWLSLGKGNSNFPWERSHWDNTVIKKKNTCLQNWNNDDINATLPTFPILITAVHDWATTELYLYSNHQS